jgi:hypothetical protein
MNVNVSPYRSRWPLWTAIAAVAAVSLTTMVLVLTRDDADRIVSSSTTQTPAPSSTTRAPGSMPSAMSFASHRLLGATEAT